MSVEGKVALITGASSGVGRGVAAIFAARGARVVAMARRRELGEQLEKEVRDAGGDLTFVQGDVQRSEDCNAAVQAALDAYGRLDVLVNNAGIEGEVRDLHSLSDDEWTSVIDVNLNGAFRCARAALGPMTEQQSGAIFNIASINAAPGFAIAHMAPYNTSKAALIQFTRTLAVEYFFSGVRVNVVVLGAVESEMYQRTNDRVARYMRGEDFERENQAGALDSMMVQQPEDVGRFLSLLCHDDARLMTGAVIAFDRGLTSGFLTSTVSHMAAAQLFPV